jgi:UDP-glucose 4-epimerase
MGAGNGGARSLSPQAQILAAMLQGQETLLPRPGVRDWIYATDVAAAVTLLIEAAGRSIASTTFQPVSNGRRCKWGEALAALHSGFICRLAEAGEAATVDLHSPADRAPLSVSRLAQEFGWRARFGCADSAADLTRWWAQHGEGLI